MFTEEMLNTYIDYKREKEVNAMRLRPHPYEFRCITTYRSDRHPESGIHVNQQAALLAKTR